MRGQGRETKFARNETGELESVGKVGGSLDEVGKVRIVKDKGGRG